jgi:hypothetical protein
MTFKIIISELLIFDGFRIPVSHGCYGLPQFLDSIEILASLSAKQGLQKVLGLPVTMN